MNNPNLKQYKYSVCILIYHRTKELVEMAEECLASVLNSSDRDETEILLCDNGSTFRSEALEKNVDTYIRFNKNMGISRGWNEMLRLAKGKYPVIIGDDVIVHDGWLEAMQKGIEMPNAGMCNPHVEHLPAGMGIVENYKWPSGACFMLSRNTIEKVGLFDEDVFFPASFEDTSYWYRIYKNGLKIYTNYGLSVQHLEGQTDNAPDIASKFDINKERFIKLHGFDPIPYFYGDGNLYDILSKASVDSQ